MSNLDELRNSAYFDKFTDILDKHFPKGECKERGAAMVMLADLLTPIAEYGEQETLKARIDENEITMNMWAKPGIGDIKFTDWAHYRHKSLVDLAQLTTNKSKESIKVIQTLNVTKVGEKLYAVNGVDSIKTLDGTVIRMNPEGGQSERGE